MNEGIFVFQVILIVIFAICALKLGKEALIVWISLQALLANIFVLKQIVLFGYEVTASDAFAVGSLLGLNFLQENFGKESARKAAWICFFSLMFFVLVSQMHLAYQASPNDTTQSAFNTILSPAPRLFFVSIIVFFFVQQFDIYFFNVLMMKMPTMRFAFRTMSTLVVSQALDTVLFSFFGLYGLVSSILDVMVLSFIVKLLSVAVITVVLLKYNMNRHKRDSFSL